MKKQLLTTLAFLLCTSVAFSQGIDLFDVDASNFPTMRAKFYAINAQGQLQRPNVNALRLTENGVQRTITSVNCPPVPVPKSLSSVLTIDISGSMRSGITSTANLELAISAATTWINLLPDQGSECAITAFDDFNYLITDFTDNKTTLQASLSSLAANGGTNYDMAFTEPMAGGLRIAQEGKYQKIMVLLTDGLPNYRPNVLAIINEARRQNCAVYVVTLGMSCPQILKDITLQTGGKWFEQITTERQINDIYGMILGIAQGAEPCLLEWQSTIECASTDRLTELWWQSAHDVEIYQAINTIVVDVRPSNITFGTREPGSTYDTTITLTARNGTITVQNIIPLYGNSTRFSVVGTTFPFILTPNSSREITLRYSPTDSSFQYRGFDIITDICPASFSVNGGFSRNASGLPSSLRLLQPNGGEKFVVGSDSVISWQGIAPSDTVTLEYSTDNGLSWKVLTNSATGLRFPWNNIPRPASDSCVVRVKQVAQNILTDSAQTLRGHTFFVNTVKWSPDGNRLASASTDRTIKIWNPNTGTELRTLTGHTSSVTSLSWARNSSRLVSGSQDGTCIIWDPLNGIAIDTFTRHTNIVRSVSWHPDGSLIASCGSDNTIRIWNAVTGVEVQVIQGLGEMLSVAWSPNGSKLAAAGLNGSIAVWNTGSWGSFTELQQHSGAVWNIVWKPDGSKLASESQDNTVIIWNTNSWVVEQTLPGHTRSVGSVSWNRAGTRLTTAPRDNTVRLWNTETWQQILTLTGHTSGVSGTAWNPDGTILASSSWDNTVKLWSVDLPILQQDISDSLFAIVEPLVAARDVVMGECLVGSMKDSVLVNFIINTGSYPFRVDSLILQGADASAFSVVSGEPPYIIQAGAAVPVEFRFSPLRQGVHNAQIVIITQADTLRHSIQGIGVQPPLAIIGNIIDFGDVFIGGLKDTLNVATIANIGTEPITIVGTRHSSPNDSDFVTIAGGGNFTLNPGDTATLNLRFSPSVKGRTNGVLEFLYNGTGSPAKVQLFGRGVESSLTVVSSNINLGEVYIGEYKDTLQAITIANTGETAIPITGITLNENSPFTLLSGNVPFVLQPNDTATLDVRFRPSAVGTFTDTVRYIFNGLGSPAIVQLLGTGIQLPAEALLATNDISAFAGDTISVPILLQQQQHLSANDISAFSLQLFFNPTLLFPLDSPFERLDYNTARLLLTAPISGRDTLTSVRFKVGLGNAEQSPLQLTDVTAIGGTATITTQSGKFTLLGVCYEGGTRLLNPDRAGGLRKIAPNPTRQSVKVELLLIERGLTELSLYNILGEKVRTLLYQHAEGNEQLSEEYDISDLAAGQYILVLTTPTFANKEIIYIVK